MISEALAWIEAHPLLSWLIGSSVANALVDGLGSRDTALGRIARAVGVDLRRALGDKPGKTGATLLLVASLTTQQACSWFRSGPGETTIATPYGTVQHRGPYVPDPAPTTIVNVWCGADAGAVVDAGGQ